MALARRSGAQGFAPDTAAFAGKGAAPSAHRRSFQVVPDASTEVVGERASNAGVLLFSAVVFAVSVSYTHLDDNEDCRPAGGARIRRKAGRS